MVYQHIEITNNRDSKDLIALEEFVIEFLRNEGFASYWERKSLDEFGKHFYKFFQVQYRCTLNNTPLFSVNLLDEYYTCYDGYKGRTVVEFDFQKVFEALNTIVTINRRIKKINNLLQQELFI
jgi:hypothetical protein